VHIIRKKMGKIKAYIDDTYSELVTKVSWPSWKELNASAVIVMVSTLITSALIYLMDVSFKFIMEMIYGFFA
jgi:preprotein translocase subunit SecE